MPTTLDVGPAATGARSIFQIGPRNRLSLTVTGAQRTKVPPKLTYNDLRGVRDALVLKFLGNLGFNSA